MTVAWAVALVASPALVAVGLLVAVRRRFVVVTVRGNSMVPSYRPGDRVLVRRRRVARISRGDVVVFGLSALDGAVAPTGRVAVSVREWAIKRVVAVAGDPVPGGGTVPPGHLFVLGDNTTTSLDSRLVGAVTTDGVLGVVVRPLFPAAEGGVRSARSFS